MTDVDDPDRYIEAEIDIREPDDKQLADYCEYIGLDPDKDPDLVWIALAGFKAELPKGWKYFKDKYDPEVTFYYNPSKDMSIAEHPLDQKYRELYFQEKQKKDSGLPYARSQEELTHPIVYEQESPPTKKRRKHRSRSSRADPQPEPEPEPVKNVKHHHFQNDPEPEQGIFELESEAPATPHHAQSTAVVISKTDDDLERMRSDNRQIIREEEDRMTEELRDMRNRHEQRVSELRTQQNAEINRMIDEFQQRKSSKQSEMQAFEVQRAGITDDHQRVIQNLRNRNHEEIEQLKATLESQLRQIERDNKNKLDVAKAAHEKNLESAKSQHQQALAQLKASNKKELDDIKKAHRSKVETMKTSHEEKLREIRSKAAQQLEREKAKIPPTKQASDVKLIDSYDESEVIRRKKNYEDELIRLAAQHASIIAEKKSEFTLQLMELTNANNKRIESARNECDVEIQKFRERAEREKKNIIRSIKYEAQRTGIIDRNLIIQKIVSISPTQKTKLKRSAAKSVSICDEFHGLCSISRPQTIFQMRNIKPDSPIKKRRNRRDMDELDMTFTERRKVDFPPIDAAESLSLETDIKDAMLVERTETEYQEMKLAMDKMQRKFDSSADRLSRQITGTFTNLNDECNDLQAFVQEQNRAMSKLSMEFRQQVMDLTQVFNHSLNDLGDVHRSAISTMSTLKRGFDVPMSPPPHVTYHPQAPFTVDNRSARYRERRHHKY